MPLLQKYIHKLAPLVLRWVDSSGIMRARMQEEHGTVWGSMKRIGEALKVEPDSFGVIVRVIDGLDADVAEDCEMVYCVRFVLG